MLSRHVLISGFCLLYSQVWLRAVGWELKKADGEGARKMLERGLQSLPRRKHVKVGRLLSYWPTFL